MGPCSLSASESVKATFASVPLDFWFCRNPGLALPLIALQYHEVKINLTLIDHERFIVAPVGTTDAYDGGGTAPKADKVNYGLIIFI